MVQQHAISFTLILAYIPLIATWVTTIVSLVLVRATFALHRVERRSLAFARAVRARMAPSCTLNWSAVRPRRKNPRDHLAEFLF